ALGLGFALGIEGDVADQLVAAGLGDVGGPPGGALFSQQRGGPRELSREIRDLDADGPAGVRGRLLIDHGIAPSEASGRPPLRTGCVKVTMPLYHAGQRTSRAERTNPGSGRDSHSWP